MTKKMNSGLRQLQILDNERSIAFPAIVQYPTTLPPSGVKIGPYTFNASLDAPMAPGVFPLCLVSHGGGGSPLLYRTITTYLAEHGFIVLSIEHPGDNRNDRSATNTVQAAIDRPRHARIAIDSLLSIVEMSSHVDVNRVSVLGHSMGGYTALALAGGRPWSRSGIPLPVKADPRVRAAVLLAPATGWFHAPGALANINVPLLSIVGTEDRVTPLSDVEQVYSLASLQPGWQITPVRGAGHFSFIAPFPPEMNRPDFPPSQDPPGFDRVDFHHRLPIQIHEFLSTALTKP